MVMAQFAMYGPRDSRTETACAEVRYYRGRKGFKKRSRDMVLKLWQANKAFCLLHCKSGKPNFQTHTAIVLAIQHNLLVSVLSGAAKKAGLRPAFCMWPEAGMKSCCACIRTGSVVGPDALPARQQTLLNLCSRV